MKKSKAVTCAFCDGLIKRMRLPTHWREDCPKIPALLDGQRVCTVCQAIKERVQFAKSTNMHRCLACIKVEHAEWKKSRQLLNPNSRINQPFVKPSAWVLKPCEFCGLPFNRREMRKHLTFCDKYTKRRHPWQAKNTTKPIANMEDIRARHVSNIRAQKSRTLRHNYGIDIAEYDRMVIAQSGRCDICNLADSGKDRGEGSLHVDHDHATGKIRGLLCTSCNHMMGNCRDSVALLLKAIDYLLKHGSVGVVS